jgi:hypothetical protein
LLLTITWTLIVELKLVLHPEAPRSVIAEIDCCMLNGSLRMDLRAATAEVISRFHALDTAHAEGLKAAIAELQTAADERLESG